MDESQSRDSMNSSPNTPSGYPEEITDELRTNLLRVQGLTCGLKVWKEILVEEERQRLGDNFHEAWKLGQTVGLWIRLRGVSRARAIIDLAFELGFLGERDKRRLLRGIRELSATADEAIETAIASGALVLVERDRVAYWKRELIRIEWRTHPALWNFFWILCEEAKKGGGVDHMHFGEEMQPNYASKIKSKLCLKDGFPHDLGDLIVPMGRGTQKLGLPPESIRLFSVRSVDRLEEITG